MFNAKDYYEHGYSIMTSHGVTATMQEDGSVILNGTAIDANAIFNYDIAASYLPARNYYTSVGSHDMTIHSPYAWNSAISGRLKKWDKATNMTYSSLGTFTQINIPEGYNPQSVLIALRCIAGKTTNNDHFYPQIINSIENPDNITWEPYNGRTYSISWSSGAGEVYGGYYDLVSGELVVTHKKYKPINYLFLSGTDTISTVAYLLPNDGALVTNGQIDSIFKVSNIVKNGNSSTVTNGSPSFVYYRDASVSATNSYVLVYGTKNDYPSASDLHDHLIANNFEVVYKLANPEVYQLNAQQMQTLVGRNNIWGVDCYTTEVSYNFTDSVDIMRIRQKVLKGCQIYRTILPPGYKEYDWLEGPSGSNSRIDTGVPGNDTTLQIDAEFMPIALNDNSYFGIYGNYVNENDSYCWRIILMAKTSTTFNCGYYVTCGNNSAGGGGTTGAYPTYNSGPMEGVKCKTRMTYGELYMEGYRTWSVTRPYAVKQENATNIAIGASRITSTGGAAIFHYYKFKFTSNGKVIRDYRPCIRLSDNKAGFYDLVNYTFNPSIGSVDFIAGNDIGGLLVYKDNSVYAASSTATVNEEITSNDDFFLTGFYDTGSDAEKSYSITCNPLYPYNNETPYYSTIRFFSEKTGVSHSYHVSQTYAVRTFTTSGRYIMCSVYKPNAANFYIFDNTNNRYVVKGSNVT